MNQAFEGIDSYLFKYGIDEMLFENEEVIDRIINGVKQKYGASFEELAHNQNELLNERDFIRTTGFIIVTTFEEKIDLFFKMIDTDGNGMLSWDEVHEIC